MTPRDEGGNLTRGECWTFAVIFGFALGALGGAVLFGGRIVGGAW